MFLYFNRNSVFRSYAIRRVLPGLCVALVRYVVAAATLVVRWSRFNHLVEDMYYVYSASQRAYRREADQQRRAVKCKEVFLCFFLYAPGALSLFALHICTPFIYFNYKNSAPVDAAHTPNGSDVNSNTHKDGGGFRASITNTHTYIHSTRDYPDTLSPKNFCQL